MITIYTTPSCSSCRKAKKWLDDFGLKYREKNLFVTPLSGSEIKYILERTENGTEDIISKRSKIIVEDGIDVDSMSMSELIEFIQKNPSILRRPIIIDDKRLQVGYNDEEIRAFIPRELRELSIACESCMNFKDCTSVHNILAAATSAGIDISPALKHK
ncbi:transcriptional regulator Spx [Culicoidibacter larvae]|uniref:Spx/MgsR family RNA polymerase-binding regulatory protein n=1 Tax=Culicoidibacter larvae TaxID=2579976 RepID=A0A5R8QC36_9FIRM|nr:Spx/MgsR family RNA polymerase-binding regulatory protein [Culicoidibacter larvae]